MSSLTTMSNLHSLLVSAAAVSMVSLYYYMSKRKQHMRAESKLPPGYTGWPLVGEIFSLMKPCPSTAIGEFMEHRISRFGKIFTANILGEPVVVSADTELNQFVLQNEMRLFENGWPPQFKKLMGATNMGVQSGQAHKQLRSIVVNFLSPERIRTKFLTDANQQALELFRSWKDNSVVSAVDAARQYTFNVIAKNVLNMKPGEPESEKLMGDFMRLNIGDSIIPLDLPGTEYSKAIQARKNILKVVKNLMEEWKDAERNEEPGENSLLLWVMRNTSLTEEQIGDLMQGVVFSGEETTTMAISLVVYFLEGCPKAMEQLREEHLQVVNSRNQSGKTHVTWEEYKKMEFTQCVINEALRLGNVSRFLLKKASTDIQFEGYEIPRGCRVLTHSSLVHLDPSLFEHPEHFNPWRWLENAGAKKNPSFMPFGGGARHCPGVELTRLEIALFLHHLVLNFDWKLVEHDQPVTSMMVHFPKGLRIEVHALSLSLEQ